MTEELNIKEVFGNMISFNIRNKKLLIISIILGVAVVIRSVEQSQIDICNSQILEFVNKKNIKIINRD